MMTEVMKSKKVRLAAALAVLTLLVMLVAVNGRGARIDVAEQLSLGQKYLQDLDYENAILVFGRIIEVEPMSVQAYRGLAAAYIGKGDTDAAIKTLERGYGKTGDPGLQEWLADLRDDVIQWADPVFEAVIRRGLKRPEGEIRRSDLDHINRLEIWGNQRTYINGYDQNGNVLLEDDPWYLEDFDEDTDVGAHITSLADVKHLRHLTYLGVMYHEVSDIAPLENLHQLDKLWLFVNEIEDISPLSELYGLVGLDLGANNISDIGPLANLHNLESLAIDANRVRDISALQSHTKLKNFLASGNQIRDISPLAGLQNPVEIDLSDNPVADWSPLSHLSEEVLYKGGEDAWSEADGWEEDAAPWSGE